MTRILRTLTLLALAAGWAAAPAAADQLAAVAPKDCKRASEVLRESDLLVSYCSMCDDDHAEVWWIEKIGTTPFDPQGKLCSVDVWGRRLLRVATFPAKEPTFWKFEEIPASESRLRYEGIDLAYVYQADRAAPFRFRVVGRRLSLPCKVKVEILHLNGEILDRARALIKKYGGAPSPK
jgi:hypothetical protein